MKKKNKLLLVIIAGICFFIIILNIPNKVHVDKSLNCFETKEDIPITVNISGTLYSYLLKDDVFIGTINVCGKRTNTRRFELQDDLYTNLINEFGEPEEMVLQFDNFSYVNIVGEDYSISNEWNPKWNKRFQMKRKVQRLLNLISKE